MLCYVEVGGLLWTTLDEVKKRIVLTSNFVTNTYSQASPGTHFVKNHDSLSLTNKSQLKKKTNKQGVLNLKCLGLYVTKQLIWRLTQNSLLQFSEIKM